MSKWLLLLLAFLFPHATDPAGGEPAEGDESTADDSADDSADEAGDDDGLDAADDAPADDTADVPAPAARARPAAGSDDAKEAVRLAREANEAVARLTQPRTDSQWAAEEAKLKDPATSDLEKWQIESNRALRDSRAASQQALFQASDMADKTQYAAKAATTPLYAKFSQQVEDELAKARKNGANPTREFVLDVVVGRSIREGNFKPKAAAKTGKDIPRGKPVNARSDTAARGNASASAKLRARLENQII